jgi:NAD-dependent SIR2 family protein deacetylase
LLSHLINILGLFLSPAGNYQPTPTHHFIKLLHDKGLLLRCFTQNIDSLEHQVRMYMSMQQQHGHSASSQRKLFLLVAEFLKHVQHHLATPG